MYAIQGMYSNSRSCVRVNVLHSEEFGVGVGVHQGAALSPLLFILVLLWGFHTGVLWVLIYVDDLVLISDTQEECIPKLKAWEAGMESKRLHVNIKKTKFLVSAVGHDVPKKSGKYPCTVRCSGVCNNFIQCSQCMLLVQKKCSGITKWLVTDPNYVCPRCNVKALPIDSRTVTEVDVNSTMFDVEATFCYLGDMLCSGWGCDSAITAIHVAWKKLRKPLPVLITRHLSPRIRSNVYKACVCPALFHGSKTWGPK